MLKTKLQNLGIRFTICGLLVISSLYLVWPDPVIGTTSSSITTAPVTNQSPEANPQGSQVITARSAPRSAKSSAAIATTHVSAVATETKRTRKIVN